MMTLFYRIVLFAGVAVIDQLCSCKDVNMDNITITMQCSIIMREGEGNMVHGYSSGYIPS